MRNSLLPIQFEARYFEKLFIETGELDAVTTKLVTELERMFAISYNGFARHFEPRVDQAKLEGKCWREILGVSRYKFNKSFDSIGVHYTSFANIPKNHWDWFQGKFYCRILNVRDNRRTLYYRNHQLIRELLWGPFTLDDGDMGMEE